MLRTSKRLQNHPRHLEFIELTESCRHLSKEQEQKQQKFWQNNEFIKKDSGEFLEKKHTFSGYQQRYFHSIEQKVYALELLATRKKLSPVFITLTLPGNFHPFRSISKPDGTRLYTSINSSFSYKGIHDAIREGYLFLNKIYRKFYKRVKGKTSDLLFVKVVEPHKTLIPHFHILFFLPENEIEILRDEFIKIKLEFGLTQVDFSQTLEISDEQSIVGFDSTVNRASKYLMKYLSKNLGEDDSHSFSRIIDGWKRMFRIRVVTSSNLPLSLEEFRTIYHSMGTSLKEKLLSEAIEREVNLFTLIMDDMGKVTKIEGRNGEHPLIKRHGSLMHKRFVILKRTARRISAIGDRYTYTKRFCFFVDRKLIYKKDQYDLVKKPKKEEKENEYKNRTQRRDLRSLYQTVRRQEDGLCPVSQQTGKRRHRSPTGEDVRSGRYSIPQRRSTGKDSHKNIKLSGKNLLHSVRPDGEVA